MPPPYHSKIPTSSTHRLVLIFATSAIFLVYLFFYRSHPSPSAASTLPSSSSISISTTTPTTLHHLAFGIASSSTSYPKRQPYIQTWWQPDLMRGFVFLDRIPPSSSTNSPSLPPILISSDTSRFPYSFPHGLRSAIRVTRIVKELVDLNLPDVRWFVFGDDDTVFFTHNLVKTLSKYNHNLWFYVGSNSESLDQNSKYSFEMAFGGGGFAISNPLARVLARVLDSCLMRYSHLYGSDSRIFSCLAELGVGLTHESGFHQVDIRGDLFGMLSAHPLVALVSLHHLDSANPIFPGMNHTRALEQLFLAVKADPARVLQQSVCYDHLKAVTISVSWGYSVQVFQGNQLVPDLLPLQRTFMPWRRNVNINSSPYMFNMREYPKDPCKRPAVFFLENVSLHTKGIQSKYKRHFIKKCLENGSLEKLEVVRVHSQKLYSDPGQLQAPRRQCCDVVTSVDTTNIEIDIRQCGDEELISMNP